MVLWLPFVRGLFDGPTYEWGGFGFSGRGTAGDYWFVATASIFAIALQYSARLLRASAVLRAVRRLASLSRVHDDVGRHLRSGIAALPGRHARRRRVVRGRCTRVHGHRGRTRLVLDGA